MELRNGHRSLSLIVVRSGSVTWVYAIYYMALYNNSVLFFSY